METDIKELKEDSKLLQGAVVHLEQRFDGLENRIDGVEIRLGNLEQKFDGFEEKMDESIGLSRKVLTIVEGMAGRVADLEQENKMGAITLHRHDIQIHELAHATDTAITE